MIAIIIVVLAVIILLWFVVIYNKLVRNRNLVQEGWSGIDVQLKKRADLIPNLLETVKGYMVHERQTLESVIAYRNMGRQADSVAEKAHAEGMLTQALGKLFALAENYPDLKANQNFLEFQASLQQIENSLEMARRYYNGTVRENNILIESFPSNIVAGMFSFQRAEFFELEDAAQREVPEVRFSS